MGKNRIVFGTLTYKNNPHTVFFDEFGNNLKISGLVFDGKYSDRVVVYLPDTEEDKDTLKQKKLSHSEWIDLLRCTDDPHVFQMEPDGKTVKAIHRKNARQIMGGIQWKIFRRDKYKCVFCGIEGGNNGAVLSIDHAVPVAKGGTDDEENLLTACRKCNKRKGDQSLQEYLGKQYDFFIAQHYNQTGIRL